MIFHILRDFIRSLGRRESVPISPEPDPCEEYRDWDAELERQTGKILVGLKLMTREDYIKMQSTQFNMYANQRANINNALMGQMQNTIPVPGLQGMFANLYGQQYQQQSYEEQQNSINQALRNIGNPYGKM